MYSFKAGDIIYFLNNSSLGIRKGIFLILDVKIEINPHGIDLGNTIMKDIKTNNGEYETLNQFIQYDLKYGKAALLDFDMYQILMGEIK